MHIRNFKYQAQPMRVRFGAKELHKVQEEFDTVEFSRALVVCSPGHSDLGARVRDLLGTRALGLLPKARMHVPIELVTEGRATAMAMGAGSLVAIGGGSAIGLAKAIALDCGIPIMAIPTTYAGSEMTSIWGITDNGGKHTGKDMRVLPRVVIYDVELTVSLPTATSITSAMNALAHAIEALYAPDVSPIISLMAVEAVRSIVNALPRIHHDGQDISARTDLQYGSWLAGACLGATTMSIHHKICHILGGAIDLPHAATHAVLLPHVVAFNAPAAPEALEVLVDVLGTSDPARLLWDLAGYCEVPRSLDELGMRESDIDCVIPSILADQYANPRPVSDSALRDLLRQAWQGSPPSRIEFFN